MAGLRVHVPRDHFMVFIFIYDHLYKLAIVAQC
jgi:hypothetical protein